MAVRGGTPLNRKKKSQRVKPNWNGSWTNHVTSSHELRTVLQFRSEREESLIKGENSHGVGVRAVDTIRANIRPRELYSGSAKRLASGGKEDSTEVGLMGKREGRKDVGTSAKKAETS